MMNVLFVSGEYRKKEGTRDKGDVEREDGFLAIFRVSHVFLSQHADMNDDGAL